MYIYIYVPNIGSLIDVYFDNYNPDVFRHHFHQSSHPQRLASTENRLMVAGLGNEILGVVSGWAWRGLRDF